MFSKHYIVIALIMGLTSAAAARAQSFGDRLHDGVYQEETVGDLEAAMTIYQQIVVDERTNRPHVAQAKFRLGMCFLKMGQRDQAGETFEKLIEEFPDQARLVEQSRTLLTVLGSLSEPDAPGVQLREVWAYSGLGQLNVLAISRDGGYCAFVDSATGGMLVRDLRTEKDQPMPAQAPHGGERATWRAASISPNNKWMAYIGSKSDSEAQSCVRIIALDGSRDRVLYPNEEKSVIRDLEWSTDGQLILATFFDTNGEQNGEQGMLGSVSVRIATVSLEDGSARILKVLTPEAHRMPRPRFSPDGRYVSYERMVDTSSKHQDVFLIPLDGSEEIHLIKDDSNDRVLGWMPDGRGLMYRSDRRGNGDDVWLMPIENGMPAGEPRLVAAGLESDLQGPVRTPTGSWAFYSAERQKYSPAAIAYTAALDPATGNLLTTPTPISWPKVGRERVESPDYSHDGRFLAYYIAPARESLEGPAYGPGSIVIRSLETGREREITLSPQITDGGWLPLLRWAPDGRSILMQGENLKRQWGIYQVNVDTGRVSPVVQQDPEMIEPHAFTNKGYNFWTTDNPEFVERESLRDGEWSPDGKTIIYKRGHKALAGDDNRLVQQTLVARDVETARETVIYRSQDGVMFNFAVSPNAQQILVAEQATLKVIPAGGGELREILKLEGPMSERICWRITWTADSRYLLFVKQVGETLELWRIAAAGGQAECVANLPAELSSRKWVEQLRVHPDGRQITFVASRYIPSYRTRMMEIVFPAEWAKESCIANLKTIDLAVKQFEHDHGHAPDHLSSLYPDYLQEANLLLCPAHDERQEKRWNLDPHMHTSYNYVPSSYWHQHVELPVIVPDEKMAKPDILKLRRKYYGGFSGLLQCTHHSPPLELTSDGTIHQMTWWGGHGRSDKGLLTQLQAAMDVQSENWLDDYDIPKLVFLLEDRAALPQLLRAYIEAHPGEANTSAKRALVETQRVRFISRSEDDANEVSNGQIELRSRFCTLGGEERAGNRAVGLRFTDVPVPQGARIKRAYVQFGNNANGDWGNEGLIFHGELSGHAASFKDVKYNITSRPKTVSSVKCSPEIWDPGSLNCRTSDMAAVIQEITAQPNWQEGNALVLIVSGSSNGEATPWDAFQGREAPMLYVETE